MDFFEHQEAARKRTTLLVAYFVAAVAAIIASVYLAIVAILAYSGEGASGFSDPSALWDPALFAVIAFGTGLLIGGGSLYRIASLSGGGHTVAELLDGRPIDPNTADLAERKVLNVVEEMAIASGTPVPPVYLLENEEGINAFAAGYTPSDAVIGVTRGCVQSLTRDELQGVIAHEFSHILNGDMRLNIRLMGVLYGILMLSVTGWWIFRLTGGDSSGRNDRDNKKEGTNPLPLVGLALYVIGFVGVIFGRLIKAAVSRQREYLADASAVQFTRNPSGIADALKKIGASADGSKVGDAEVEEASHMFFGEALGLSGSSLLSTHPPLSERIRRIDPTFDGDFSQVQLSVPHDEGASSSAERRPVKRFDPVRAISGIGTLGADDLAYASVLLGSLPGPVVAAARDPYGAGALIYALLLDPADEAVRAEQLAALEGHAPSAIVDEAKSLWPAVVALGPEARLPLVELAIPALRRLSPAQFDSFSEDVRLLVEADRRIDLFEYALRRMLLRHLAPQFRKTGPPRVLYTSPAPLIEPTTLLLSALARADLSETSDPARSFRTGVEALGWPLDRAEPLPPDATTLEAVDRALKAVESASPALKKRILEACASCIGADGRITAEEGELLRAVADALDCPMPPLVAGGA